MSERLYYQIKNHIIPHINFNNQDKSNIIEIDTPFARETYNGSWNGTGISLGVDSFTTIHEYLEESMPEEYRLTHVVHLKAGAHHGMKKDFDKDLETRLFNEENDRVQRYCKEHKLPLITIETNIYEITSKEFDWDFSDVHAYHNLGTILILQNYFRNYYYASASPMTGISIDIRRDTERYERWLLPLISTENTNFYSANKNMNRWERTKYISQFEDTHNYLHVCWQNSENCGRCGKCIRTQIQLDFMGILNKYKNVFDLDAYYKNKKKYLTWVIAMRVIDSSYQSIYKYMVANNIKRAGFFAVNLTRIKICIEKIKMYGFSKLFNIKKR